MRKITLFILPFLLGYAAFSQDKGSVEGKVVDKNTNEPLPGATVSIKGTLRTVDTNSEGRFVLKNLNAGSISLVISYVGYKTLELNISIPNGNTTGIITAMSLDDVSSDEIVISASKHPQKIVYAPASIQVIGAKDLSQFPGSNVNELAAKLPGIEYTRSGVDEITFNARGLNSAFNIKVFQLVDGRNSMAAASGGVALFNNGSTSKEDIERIEIILGPQTALYGPNAHNALFNYITKDPRKYQGTTIAVSAGSQNQFSSRFRHALKVNHKWAYKLTGEHATGKDYEWYDTVYAGGNAGLVVNGFGPPVAIPERIHDFSFRRYRGEGHLYYSIKPNADVIVSGGGSKFTRLQVTTTGRNQLRDVTYGFLQARFVHRNLFANIYNTWGNLGKTINIVNYTRDFWNRTHSRLTTGPNRYLPPDSAELFATRLGNTIKEKSQRFNTELQYNYHFKEPGVFLVAGLSYQKEKPNGYGISLVDSFHKIIINQYGAVLQLEKQLPWALKLMGTARVDHHSNFGTFLAPRIALTKKTGNGSFRVTWGKAYAMPSILNQYAGVNRFLFGNGDGILYIPNGTNVRDTASFKTTTALKPEMVKTWEFGYKGALTEKIFIDISYYDGLSKNFISPPVAVGGKVLKVNEIPVTHNPAFAGMISNDTLRGASFLTYFNYGDVRTYGLDLGLNYTFNRYFNASIKYSWFGSDLSNDNIKNDANNDGYVSPEEKSLNAPHHKGALILNGQNLLKEKLFAGLTIRYVQQYEFYSGNQVGTESGKGKRGVISRPGQPPILKNFDWGPLGGFTTVDLSAGYKFNEIISVNMGITNLLNTRQIEFVGSPSIGRLFMAELKLHLPTSSK